MWQVAQRSVSTVLRDGRVTGETVPTETSREQLAEMMVGRQVKLAPDKPEIHRGPDRLVIAGLEVTGDRGTAAVAGVDLAVAGGEIVGIAGVSGNGQRELAEAVAGLRPARAGSVQLDGSQLVGSSPRTIRRAGLAYVPEERMREGAIADFSVSENLVLTDHDNDEFSARGVLKLGAIRKHAATLVKEYDVKTPSIDTTTGSLSGGNIQKVIMARELSGDPAVLVASQPTRGVDIGAAEYIHRRLIEQRDLGTAILVISEDLDEVLGLADRVAVMFEGKIVAVRDRSECNIEELGLLMAGG